MSLLKIVWVLYFKTLVILKLFYLTKNLLHRKCIHSVQHKKYKHKKI